MSSCVWVRFNSRLLEKKEDKNKDPVEIKGLEIIEDINNELMYKQPGGGTQEQEPDQEAKLARVAHDAHPTRKRRAGAAFNTDLSVPAKQREERNLFKSRRKNCSPHPHLLPSFEDGDEDIEMELSGSSSPESADGE